MTAEPYSPLVERVLRLGAREVLLKPFNVDKLEFALERSTASVH